LLRMVYFTFLSDFNCGVDVYASVVIGRKKKSRRALMTSHSRFYRTDNPI
jgi:hypothetical protein